MTRDSSPRLGAWVKLPVPESVDLLALAEFDFVALGADTTMLRQGAQALVSAAAEVGR